jgi:DNA replication protein DnaC
MDRCGVEPRFWGKSLESFRAKSSAQKEVLAIARDYAYDFPKNYAAGRSLIFSGLYGTGKTLLACGIIWTLIHTSYLSGCREYDGHCITAFDMIGDIRDTWGNAKISTAKLIEGYAGYSLLVIDDIGANKGTEGELELLSNVIDLRYRKQLPTIITTNLDLEGLGRFIGKRSIDRLRDHGGTLCAFNWPSYRH